MANEIINRAKAQRAARAAQCRLEVPEWGDGKKPLVVTWSPITVAQRRKLFADDDAGNSPHGGLVMVRALINHAHGADGKRLFDEMDEHELLHEVDADVVGKIGNAILYGVNVTPPATSQEAVEQAKNG
jgi:hypothetical protein